ncbi:MAG TPA: glycoside hydrolase family 3 N-terminal domain-containing protein [Microvirga sp.]|nr:glycoside hydrolase family 3 N-terminal domain-containing protein [Microvirga sp.]
MTSKTSLAVRVLALATALLWGSGPQAQPERENRVAPMTGMAQRLDVETRVNDLLARMTLDEKIGQLNLISHGETLNWDDLSTGRIGALINFNNAQDISRAQRLARESRLGIPFLFGLDVLHGFRTQFPVPLAEAAAFSPRISRLAAEWQALEAAYVGINWTYAPMADLSRDVRWGRLVEGFGEDPHLGSVLTAARVEGFHAGGMATTAKHFVGYGAPEGGRDYDTTNITSSDLRDLYLPSFKAAVDAGTEAVMAAFNVVNGLPSMANPGLLTGVLRNEWGFDGIVTSDWAGIHELLAHGIAADDAEAARKAFLAGVDMDMMGRFYINHLADEVRAGRVPMERIDEAVRRVLRVKFRMGLFERPIVDERRVDAIFPSTEARAVAREITRETLVLLRNWNDVLPFKAETRSIAVVGPLSDATRDQLGPHGARAHAEDAVSVVEGLRRRAAGTGVQINHVPGCDRYCTSLDGLDAALAAARSSDVVVAVIGEYEKASGEAASRAYLTPVGRQLDLVEALVATGKPVVLVVVAGRPVELGRVGERIPAILMGWFPGTEAGAIADVLFGDFNPSGKLPVSWPRTVGQLPLAYNRLPTGRPPLAANRYTLGYIDEGVTPLFPFGHGLSYTTFAYSDLALAKPSFGANESMELRATVRNTGTRAGQEVVQLYVRDPVASRSRPVRELKAFEKIALQPGEARTVTLRVPVRNLGFHLEDGTYVVEPGEFQVFVGGSSLADLEGRFTVTEELRIEAGQRRAAR